VTFFVSWHLLLFVLIYGHGLWKRAAKDGSNLILVSTDFNEYTIIIVIADVVIIRMKLMIPGFLLFPVIINDPFVCACAMRDNCLRFADDADFLSHASLCSVLPHCE
jgi:hypothetical protein